VVKLRSTATHDALLILDLKKYASNGCGFTYDILTDKTKSETYFGVSVSFIKDKKSPAALWE
jgi:hypothetical protein